MAAENWPHRSIAAMLPMALACCLSGSPGARAYTAPAAANPFGPVAAPLANPFPTAPAGAEQPNFQYRTNLEPANGALPAPGFRIVPRIGIAEEFSDNILQSQDDRSWDLVTLVSPGVAISADTPRINLSLNYNPILRYFARHPSQNSIGHQLLAVGSAEVVPDQFYVNVRAFANSLPRGGGGGAAGFNFGTPSLTSAGFNTGTRGIGKNNLSQVETASITPYLVHRFGNYGTGKFAVRMTQTYASNTSTSLITPSNAPRGPTTHGITGEVLGQFVSGDAFGRFVDIATIDAQKTTGTGTQKNSSRALASNRVGYVVARPLLVFAEAGVESIQYHSTTPRIDVQDAIWGVGATVLPNPDSQLTAEYGHHNGVTSFQGSARYAVSARTVLSARYVAGLTTDLQDIARRLEEVGVNPLGNPINLDTGAPPFLANSLGGITNTIYKSHTLSLSAVTLLNRNTISLRLERQERAPVATVGGGTSFGDTNTTISATWLHDLSIRTSLTGSLSYGVRDVHNAGQNLRYVSATALVRHFFSDKLIGIATYNFIDRNSNVAGASMYENILLVGLTRTF